MQYFHTKHNTTMLFYLKNINKCAFHASHRPKLYGRTRWHNYGYRIDLYTIRPRYLFTQQVASSTVNTYTLPNITTEKARTRPHFQQWLMQQNHIFKIYLKTKGHLLQYFNLYCISFQTAVSHCKCDI